MLDDCDERLVAWAHFEFDFETDLCAAEWGVISGGARVVGEEERPTHGESAALTHEGTAFRAAP